VAIYPPPAGLVKPLPHFDALTRSWHGRHSWMDGARERGGV